LADRDRCSYGMYRKSLRRCYGKRTGGWYCRTHKRDPILRELIFGSWDDRRSWNDRRRRSRRDEPGFVCASDRFGFEPHCLFCGRGLAVGRRTFKVREHRPVRASVRQCSNSPSYSLPQSHSALSRRRRFALSFAPFIAQLLWDLRWNLDRDFRSILRWLLPSTWLLQF
jgi:hypothetical protein